MPVDTNTIAMTAGAALQGMFTEMQLFWLFYKLYGKKGMICFLLPVSFILGMLEIPVLELHLLLVVSLKLPYDICLHSTNLLLNLLILSIVERREKREKILFYIAMAYFVWTAFYTPFVSLLNEFGRIYGVNIYSGIRDNVVIVLIVAVNCGIVYLLLILLDRRYSLQRAAEYLWEKTGSPLRTICFALLVITILSLMDILRSVQLSGNMMDVIFGILFSAAIIVFVHQIGITILRKEKEQVREVMLEQQEMYIHELESIQSNMRTFRHDYKNMMSSLYLSSKEGRIWETEQNIHDMIEEFDESIDRKMNLTMQMANIKNMAVKSLLYKKLMEIRKKRIDFRMEVLYPVDDTCMKPLDLSRILGILLDNAIEAVEETGGNIVLSILAQEGGLYIVVDNSAKEAPDLERMYQSHYSTKGSGRGMGLYSLKRILEKYSSASIITEYRNERLIQRITVPKNREKRCGGKHAQYIYM